VSRQDVFLHLRILKRIQQHTQSNPITGASIAAEFGTSWRNVASVVEDLRDSGHKIGSSKGGKDKGMGYFLAHDPSEIHSTCLHMESQAKKILSRANKLRNWGSAQPTIFESSL